MHIIQQLMQLKNNFENSTITTSILYGTGIGNDNKIVAVVDIHLSGGHTISQKEIFSSDVRQGVSLPMVWVLIAGSATELGIVH